MPLEPWQIRLPLLHLPQFELNASTGPLLLRDVVKGLRKRLFSGSHWKEEIDQLDYLKELVGQGILRDGVPETTPTTTSKRSR